MESEWNRVSPKNPCKICGKPDWGLLSSDKTAAICPRTTSDKYIDGSGYLHILDKNRNALQFRKTRTQASRTQLPEHNGVMELLMRGYVKEATDRFVMDASKTFRVAPKTLRDMEIGWSVTKNAVAFPMKRLGNRLLGIRFRTPRGSKFAAKGSKQGLFIPNTFHRKQGIVVCEGPTDTASMLDLGFNAIGRPSCNSGSMLIAELAKDMPVALLVDNDSAGKDASTKLSDHLKSNRPKLSRDKVRLVECGGYKDAREWKDSGATREEILKEIRKT